MSAHLVLPSVALAVSALSLAGSLVALWFQRRFLLETRRNVDAMVAEAERMEAERLNRVPKAPKLARSGLVQPTGPLIELHPDDQM